MGLLALKMLMSRRRDSKHLCGQIQARNRLVTSVVKRKISSCQHNNNQGCKRVAFSGADLPEVRHTTMLIILVIRVKHDYDYSSLKVHKLIWTDLVVLQSPAVRTTTLVALLISNYSSSEQNSLSRDEGELLCYFCSIHFSKVRKRGETHG
uniref:Uncharacterized protein n=1 Tax=Aegilops tauschii subsp. strangulata TaxID=200361 RepID=A0A453J5Q9_AEGTS